MFLCASPIGLTGTIGGSLHNNVVLAYGVFRWLETVEAHSGYDFPFSPFQGICAGAAATVRIRPLL